jgi:hypothetical protein
VEVEWFKHRQKERDELRSLKREIKMSRERKVKKKYVYGKERKEKREKEKSKKKKERGMGRRNEVDESSER